jgi:hypothetical protein
MRKAAVTVAGAAVALVVLWGVVHIMITPINPAQESPDDHFEASCSLCHIVTESAEEIR